MTTSIDVLARALAKQAGRALPIRETSALGPDPASAFGIAPIKLVSEEHIQAIAYGDLGGPPRILTRWNPLSRDSKDLDEFAESLDEYLVACVEQESLPRIWLPHEPALVLIDLLGHRYRNNSTASEELRKMGWNCHALAEEARFEGQQCVAVAADLLRDHLVTGQAPRKDSNLRSLLAWVDPPSGVDPAAEADREALLPAASMLPRDADDQVERLRREAKGSTPRALHSRARIEEILAAGASEEWDLLVLAREKFWGLGLPSDARTAQLMDASTRRVLYAITSMHAPPGRPHSLARLLQDQEHSSELRQDVDVGGDARVRERLRRKGRVFSAQIAAIDQPTPNRHPCDITLRTSQEVLRVRRGTQLRNLAGGLVGRVTGVNSEASTGATLLTLNLKKGVRRSALPALGSETDWTDSLPFDARFIMSGVYSRMRDSDHPLVYGDALPRPVPRSVDERDLLEVAEGLRRRS